MADYDLGAAFAAIEEELISSMIRNFKRHRAEETAEGFQWSQWQADQLDALETYRRRNQAKFGKQFKDYNQTIEAAIVNAYTKGGADQEEEILEAIRMGASLRNHSDRLGGSFFHTNERKLNALVHATTSDIERAETAVLRRANDAYRKTIFNAQVYANTGAGTYEKAVDMATRDFLAAGLQCVVYKNGAQHTLSDYADMAIRTASKRAYLQGEGAKRQEWGISTVIINRRGGACPKCARYCGKVFIDDVWSGGKKSDGKYPLLSSAVRGGLYHPRCKDSHSTYFPELHEDEDPYTPEEIRGLERQEKREQRQQYAQRQAERFDRLARFSLDPENIRRYRAQAKQWAETAEAEPFVRQAKQINRNVRAEYGDGLVAVAAQNEEERNFLRSMNATDEYERLATPGIGSVSYEPGYDMSESHSEERAMAQWLLNTFGGEITLLAESTKEGQETPDFVWNGKLWELKSLRSSTYAKTDKRLQKGYSQTRDNRGGVIMDYSKSEIDIETAVEYIQRSARTRVKERTDVIVIKNERKIVLRFYK